MIDEDGKHAEQIVNEYGAALSHSPGMAKPASSLKHSKEEIKFAIKEYILSLKKANKLNKDMISVLSLGYASIDFFIPDKEAELMGYVEKLKDNTQLPQELIDSYDSYVKNAAETMKNNVEEIKQFLIDKIG